jgi:hypothetical protein
MLEPQTCRRPGCKARFRPVDQKHRLFCSPRCRDWNERQPSTKPSPGRVSEAAPKPQEASDDYPDIVVVLDPKTRVIAADIQWIIQRRRGEQWRGEYFFRTKEGLLLYAPKPTAPELLALPDRFPETNH